MRSGNFSCSLADSLAVAHMLLPTPSVCVAGWGGAFYFLQPLPPGSCLSHQGPTSQVISWVRISSSSDHFSLLPQKTFGSWNSGGRCMPPDLPTGSSCPSSLEQQYRAEGAVSLQSSCSLCVLLLNPQRCVGCKVYYIER